MKRPSGFTVIEVLVVVLIVALLGVSSYLRQDSTRAVSRDRDRKIALNAMYYNLEEVFYKQNGYYPVEISSGNLPAMDPALFTDPDGVKLGDAKSNYRYEASSCDDQKCQSYTLRADLQREADFVKTNRH